MNFGVLYQHKALFVREFLLKNEMHLEKIWSKIRDALVTHIVNESSFHEVVDKIWRRNIKSKYKNKCKMCKVILHNILK